MFLRIGKHIFLHKFFFFLPLIIFLRGKAEYYFIMLASVFLHEAAHFFAAWIFKQGPDRLFISPYGFELRLVSTEPSHEAVILISGPAVSIVLAGLGYFANYENIFRANAFVCAVNLLPAYPLDGGKILKIGLWSIFGVYKGNKILKKISYLISLAMLFYAILKPSVWLLTVSLLIINRTKTLRGTPFYTKRCRFTPVRTFRVSSSVTPIEALHLFSPYYYTCIFIEQTNRCLTEKEIINLAESHKSFSEL